MPSRINQFISDAKQSLTRKAPISANQRWLVPGDKTWILWQQTASGCFELLKSLTGDEVDPILDVTHVGLPASLVICQLFWLETSDEKAVPDMLRLQCERRRLLQQDTVWTHRIVRHEGTRVLALVLILQGDVPHAIEVETSACFEAMPRCLAQPPRTLSLRRSLGTICVALSDDSDLVYFQCLPHATLSASCLRDVNATILVAMAQKWMPSLDSVMLFGEWDSEEIASVEAAFGIKPEIVSGVVFSPPAIAMQLIPGNIRRQRVLSKRRRKIRSVALALGAIYALFVTAQIFTFLLTSLRNDRLETRLNAIMPEVEGMQNTARLLDSVNPAIDSKTYPLELIYRISALLPENGIRLTQLEIIEDKIAIRGESTTAREAFDFIDALERADTLNHIRWDEAPQPIPLPNDTTRFSIQGTIEGAYHEDSEQS